MSLFNILFIKGINSQRRKHQASAEDIHGQDGFDADFGAFANRMVTPGSTGRDGEV